MPASASPPLQSTARGPSQPRVAHALRRARRGPPGLCSGPANFQQDPTQTESQHNSYNFYSPEKPAQVSSSLRHCSKRVTGTTTRNRDPDQGTIAGAQERAGRWPWFVNLRQARKAAVCTVLPNPISSARIPPKPPRRSSGVESSRVAEGAEARALVIEIPHPDHPLTLIVV